MQEKKKKKKKGRRRESTQGEVKKATLTSIQACSGLEFAVEFSHLSMLKR